MIPFVPIDCDDCPKAATRSRLHVPPIALNEPTGFQSARRYAMARGWTFRPTQNRTPGILATCPKCQPKPKKEK